nr:MAG TPA: hypothetical protein [Caudoviricetes sp.]
MLDLHRFKRCFLIQTERTRVTFGPRVFLLRSVNDTNKS